MSDLPTSALPVGAPPGPAPHEPSEQHPTWSRHRIAFLAGAVILAVLALLAALLVATRDDTRDQVASTTTTLETTTTVETTTTTAEPTTTTVATTTTKVAPAPVTVGPTYPTALGRHLVPWDQIDDGWTLVVYDGCSSPEANDPAVVYLVDPVGTRYEITTLPATAAGEPCWPQWTIADWAVDGDVALLGQSCCGETEHEILDLRSGERTPALRVSIGSAGLTRPTGRQIVAESAGPDVRTLARYDVQGNVQVVFEESPYDQEGWAPHHSAWLYTPDGTALVLGGGWSSDAPPLVLVANDASWRRTLDTPGEQCTPLRWWDDATVVAHCRVPGTEDTKFAVWLIPIDGSAASLLADPGPDCPDGCGHADAWWIDGTLLLQRVVPQGDFRLERVLPDGSVVELPVPAPHVGQYGLQVHDGRVIVLQRDLTAQRSELLSLAADGTDVAVLVPAIGGTHGVTSAAPLATSELVGY